MQLSVLAGTKAFKLVFAAVLLLSVAARAQVSCGADQMAEWLPLLKGKNVGLLVNHTSRVGNRHLVDTLMKCGVKVKKIYCPEHGFRGDADAGEAVKGGKDKATGLPIVSLYGDHKKPLPSELKGIDVVIFDIQDVGVRFYTYLGSLHYMMEACAENKKEVLVLDRPNPNGFYVDGPVLDTAFRSFVGMHPVPVVHGMTVGEYAQMINGEGWLKRKNTCSLRVIKCKGYDHNTVYKIPVKPSPNLATQNAIYWYPSLCWLEGTLISVGRGTDLPFEQIGHPSLPKDLYSFTPRSIPGASKTPPYLGETCYGFKMENIEQKILREKKMDITWLIKMYQLFPDKDQFFNSFFVKLAGNREFEKQIREGLSEEKIRESWKPGIDRYLKIREKYLLYP